MKLKQTVATVLLFLLLLTACDSGEAVTAPTVSTETASDVIDIMLNETTVECSSDAVFTENVDDHTVVRIAKAGIYRLSGKLSKGQILVDLGENAKTDPNACVNLILNNADITCTNAPAVLFYRAYECAAAEFVQNPDLTNAGATVTLSDGTQNFVNGAYVEDSYDGAFHSTVSMRIEGNGALSIVAENEGLDSERHLTIDGGDIRIQAQNDGINTNEDGISVTTVNAGSLYISGGLGEEGDGIDSNGAIVVNGGQIVTTANERTGDGGIDADLGIYLNGGRVIATGSRNDTPHIESAQEYMELYFASQIDMDRTLEILSDEETVFSFVSERPFTALTISVPELSLQIPYSLRIDGKKQQHQKLPHMGELPQGPLPTEPNKPDVDIPAPPQPPQEQPQGDKEPPQEQPQGDKEPPQDGKEPPQGDREPPQGGQMPSGIFLTDGQTEFILSEENCSFSFISDANGH